MSYFIYAQNVSPLMRGRIKDFHEENLPFFSSYWNWLLSPFSYRVTLYFQVDPLLHWTILKCDPRNFLLYFLYIYIWNMCWWKDLRFSETRFFYLIKYYSNFVCIIQNIIGFVKWMLTYRINQNANNESVQCD